jgi:uncharacterized protein YqeY
VRHRLQKHAKSHKKLWKATCARRILNVDEKVRRHRNRAELLPRQVRVSLQEQIQADVKQAMRERQRERLTALRLLLSEVQKAHKDGQTDELAVLRRERKRRLESAAAYADAGRSDLEAAERAEAELIGAYLPAQLEEQELRQIVEQAVADSGAQGAKEMGVAMKSAIAAVDGRAEGKRVSELVKETLLR